MEHDACDERFTPSIVVACRRTSLMMPTAIEGNVIYELQTAPAVGQFGSPYIEDNTSAITEIRSCNSTDPGHDQEFAGVRQDTTAFSPATVIGLNKKQNLRNEETEMIPSSANYKRTAANIRETEESDKSQRSDFSRSTNVVEAKRCETNNVHVPRKRPKNVGNQREDTDYMEVHDKNSTRRISEQNKNTTDKPKKRTARRYRASLDDLSSRSDIVWHDNVPHLVCNFPPCRKEIPFDKAPGSKKFCCLSCAKRYNVYSSQRMKDYRNRQVALGKDAYNPSRRRRKRRVSVTSASSDAEEENDNDRRPSEADRKRRFHGGSDDGDIRRDRRASLINLPKSATSTSTNYAGRVSTADRGTSPTESFSSKNSTRARNAYAESTSSRDDKRTRHNYVDTRNESADTSLPSQRTDAALLARDSATESDDDDDYDGSDSSTSHGEFSPANSRESRSNIQPETDVPSSSGGIISNSGTHYTASELTSGDGGANQSQPYVSVDDMISRKPLACWTKDEIALLVRHVVRDDGGSDSSAAAVDEMTPVGEHSVAKKFLTAQIDGEAFMLMSQHQQLIKDVGILLGPALKLIKKRKGILDADINKRWMEQHNIAL